MGALSVVAVVVMVSAGVTLVALLLQQQINVPVIVAAVVIKVGLVVAY